MFRTFHIGPFTSLQDSVLLAKALHLASDTLLCCCGWTINLSGPNRDGHQMAICGGTGVSVWHCQNAARTYLTESADLLDNLGADYDDSSACADLLDGWKFWGNEGLVTDSECDLLEHGFFDDSSSCNGGTAGHTEEPKRIMLNMTWPLLADLFHLPSDVKFIHGQFNNITQSLELILTSPDAVRDVAAGTPPPAYLWDDVISRNYK